MLISIDLPGAANCGGQTATERRLFRAFIQPGQRLACLPRDSHDPATPHALRRLLGAGGGADT